ncbi:MAG: hypothetical protein RL637_568 [Pseudomonadota bacterium]
MKKIFLFIILFISLPFYFRSVYLFESAIFYGYDPFLEYQIYKTVSKVKKNRDFTPVQLQNFNKKKITKVCIQTPYEPQFSFEERIGNKVSNYSETDDDGMYVLWLFFSDGSIKRSLFREMDGAKYSAICSKITTLSFKLEDNSIKFF